MSWTNTCFIEYKFKVDDASIRCKCLTDQTFENIIYTIYIAFKVRNTMKKSYKNYIRQL